MDGLKKIWSFLRNTLNSLKKFQNLRNLNGYEKWHTFYEFVFIWGIFLQIELFTKRPNGLNFKMVLFMSVFSSMLVFYTTCYYIHVGDFAKVVPCYCMFGIMASAYSAAWNLALDKQHKWTELLELSGKYIYRNDNQPTAYNRICSESMDRTLKSFILTITVALLSFVGAMIGPVSTYLKDGTVVTLYEVRIPFLQEHPNTEFMVNIIWQFYISVIAGIPALFGIEGMTAIVNNAITVSSMLFVNQLEEFSDELENGKTTKKHCGRRLMKIFNQIIFMDEHIEKFREAWYWRVFLSTPTFLFSISVSIYCQFVLGFPAGYGIALVSYVQMGVFCVTGQNIVDRNKRLLSALYDFKWYLLPTEYQKDVLYMIQHMQNKNGLTIGPFEQLNFETLKYLTQKVYSVLMFLMNF